MKFRFLTLLGLISLGTMAQNSLPTTGTIGLGPKTTFTGNVGIGTTTPTAPLEINYGNTSLLNWGNTGIKFRTLTQGKPRYSDSSWADTTTNFLTVDGSGNMVLQNAGIFYKSDGFLTGNRTVKMNGGNLAFTGDVLGDAYPLGTPPHFFINGTTGNVGVGTQNPDSKLTVNGDISSTGLNQRIGFSTNDKFTNPSGTIAHYGMSLTKNVASQPIVSHSGYFGINFYTVGAERMRISENGNVGIGTQNPDSKLTVKGKIHTEEVVVDLAVPADYVFEKYFEGKSTLKADYTMPTLEEIEAYTKANKHLPNIPSAKEMQTNGVELGDMTNKLLQKIEELTLYSIEQQKRINTLEKENESFKKLEERFNRLEKSLEINENSSYNRKSNE